MQTATQAAYAVNPDLTVGIEDKIPTAKSVIIEERRGTRLKNPDPTADIPDVIAEIDIKTSVF